VPQRWIRGFAGNFVEIPAARPSAPGAIVKALAHLQTALKLAKTRP
jgi:hypothetical protein